MVVWDPNRNFFIVPYIDHPITWYGVLFAFGFLIGYFLIRKIFAKLLFHPDADVAKVQLASIHLADRLTFLSVIGTLIGARLGHVFFYGWPYYKKYPIEIFKIWQGGLASHGAAVGILLGLILFVVLSKSVYPQLTFRTVLDIIVIPAAFIGGCIRIGNFMNQEILGISTALPWGVVFLHPMDGTAGVAVHPVQLYESCFYFLTFAYLFLLWKRGKEIGSGLYSGCFFVLVFVFRFFVEFLKAPQSELLDTDALLSMGQILSFPFILLGAFLLFFYFRQKNNALHRVC